MVEARTQYIQHSPENPLHVTLPDMAETVTSFYDVMNTTEIENITLEAAYKDFYEQAKFITGLICYPAMCIFGLAGNVFILVVMGQKSMLTSTNIFLSALAISDIIKLLNDFLYFFTVLLSETWPSVGNKWFGYLYPYAHYFFNTAVCVSAWLTVSVAVERYILVCHPARAKTLTSIPRAKVISGLCFLSMMLVGIPQALRYRTIEITVIKNGHNVTELDIELTELWENDQFVLAYNWLQSLLRYIPLVILIITSTFIINAVRRTRANKKMASRNKITIMLIIVILFFLFCTIPDAVMSGIFNFGYAESDDNLVKGVREITDMMLGVNAAINFALYMIFNKVFREQFILVFCPKCADSAKQKEEAKYQRLSQGKHVVNGTTQTDNGHTCESHV